MALTTEQLKNYSWMSQASYLDFQDARDVSLQLTSSPINSEKVFSIEQTNSFTDPANGYSFINHEPNDSSGFSATVFKSNADGSYTISVRGTEPSSVLSDLLNADAIGVVTQGAAYKQTISAYLYYKRLTTNGTVTYTQAELDALGGMFAASQFPAGSIQAVNAFLAELQNPASPFNAGTGELVGATANFAGHSLGGHVATLLAGLVSEFGTTPVGDVATYNAPGMGGIFGLDTVNLSSIAGKITNIIADHGMDITAGLATQNGETNRLFIEGTDTLSIENHSIVRLTDSLAVYDLFAKIDANLTLDDITGILTASDNTASESLESAVSALGELLVSGFTPRTANEYDVDTAASSGRDLLYTDLQMIEATLPPTLISGLSIETFTTSLADGTEVPLTSAQILAKAESDIAYRYALVEGNTFAVVAQDPTFYDTFNANGELDIYGQGGHLTEQYLADRSDYMANLIQANIDDSSDTGSATNYVDLGAGINLNAESFFFTPDRKVMFGTEGDDTYGLDVTPLAGGDGGDLYVIEAGSTNTIIDSGNQGRIMLSDAAGNMLRRISGDFTRTDPASNTWTNDEKPLREAA